MFRQFSIMSVAAAFVFMTVIAFLSAPAAHAYPLLTLQQQQYLLHQRQLELRRRGAKPSYAWRQYGRERQQVRFQTQIQHVVVIDMENRSVDNLFSAYWGSSFNGGPPWQNVMNIANPNGSPTLTPVPLEAQWDPHHTHLDFNHEAKDGFGHEGFSCRGTNCNGDTAFAYVPTRTAPYAQIVQQYASADDVYQANQGPSMPSHQYLIAGQAGGVTGPPYTALGSNPTPPPGFTQLQNGNDDEEIAPDGGLNQPPYCLSENQAFAPSLDMSQPFYEPTGPATSPCETYASGTILDETVGTMGTPHDLDWQYIAHQETGYWSAPTAVLNLFTDYNMNPLDPAQPFAVDPNAWNFVQSLHNVGQPQRPFAALTYITPCPDASDHADTTGNDVLGPKWVGALINEIGNSSYWPHTAIIVTWDDWGGWYDHMHRVESQFNPYPNGGGGPPNVADPNEWGFRVPVMVISPYSPPAGYVSHGPNMEDVNHPRPRSQSAILNLIEYLFQLPSLGTDDKANWNTVPPQPRTDDMEDLFDFTHPYTAFNPINVPAFRDNFGQQCGI